MGWEGSDHEENAPSLSISLSVQIGRGRGVPLHTPDDIRQVPVPFSAAKPLKHTGLYHFTCQDAPKGRPSTLTLAFRSGRALPARNTGEQSTSPLLTWKGARKS